MSMHLSTYRPSLKDIEEIGDFKKKTASMMKKQEQSFFKVPFYVKLIEDNALFTQDFFLWNFVLPI